MDNICVNIEDEIAFLLMNRAPVNALSTNFVFKISNALEKISKSDAKCLIIHSKQRHFCAGADLKERSKMDDKSIFDAVKKIQNCFNEIYNLEIPVISVINGAALGGGIELALACDFRIAEKDIVLGFPETELGIIPGAGGTQRLSRLLGPSKAKYYIFTAERIGIKEALEIGLVDHESKKNEGINDAIFFAKKITNKKKLSIINAKKSINQGFNLPLRDALKIEFECYKNSKK